MSVNRNTIVLFREIQEEGRKLLDQGVNPEITCEFWVLLGRDFTRQRP